MISFLLSFFGNLLFGLFSSSLFELLSCLFFVSVGFSLFSMMKRVF